MRHDLVVLVEQVALAIALVDRAEDPAVAVKVGELRVLELLVELRRADLSEEFRIAPQPLIAACSGLRCGSPADSRVGSRLLRAGYMCLPSVSFSHHV